MVVSLLWVNLALQECSMQQEWRCDRRRHTVDRNPHLRCCIRRLTRFCSHSQLFAKAAMLLQRMPQAPGVHSRPASGLAGIGLQAVRQQGFKPGSYRSSRNSGTTVIRAATSNSAPPATGGAVSPGSIHVPRGMNLAQYPSLKGKNILITGGARGLGLCSAKLLANLGAHVYLADIDTKTLESAVESLRKEVPGAQVTACPQLDLGNQAAIHAFADWWLSQGLPLHVLVNNAGANFMGIEPWFTDQGVAGLPQVNYVGPYTLTRRLSSCLEATAAAACSEATAIGNPAAAMPGGQARARIVNLCSVMHRFAELPADPQFFLKDWWIGGSYRNCKLALTVTTELWQNRFGPRGIDCISVDPGAVYSGIWSTSKTLGRPPGSTILSMIFATPQDACATTVHAVAAADVVPGGYYARGLFASSVIVDSKVEPLAGFFSSVDWPLRNLSQGAWASGIQAVPVAPGARSLQPVEALWDACADLAGMPREI